ncbi:hypothetical protein, partial [Streptomyces cacaoi]|uniref:hypothetical protein n=1 Tax=Streptomyces cacaoi TaxID=1898 RepID=UPI0035D65FA7
MACAPAAKQRSTRCFSSAGSPSVPAAPGVLGDGVGRLAAGRHHTVHPYPGRQLPAQQPDRDLRDREGVGGVPALFGVGGGVRGPAPVVDGAVCDGERVGLGDVHGAGVAHHREVHPVEDAALQRMDPAAAALLRRGAEHRDAQAEFVGDRGRSGGGADGARGDHVVPAGVAEPGQRVVLGAHAHVQRARVEGGGERGGQPAGAGDERVAEGVQCLARPACGLLLLPGGLRAGVDRVGVDAVAQRQQVLGA